VLAASRTDRGHAAAGSPRFFFAFRLLALMTVKLHRLYDIPNEELSEITRGSRVLPEPPFLQDGGACYQG
jgi:hypothetical protein